MRKPAVDPQADARAVAELGVVAPALGWRARGGGRAAWAHPARSYVATTTQLGRTMDTLRAHGGFTEPDARDALLSPTCQ